MSSDPGFRVLLVEDDRLAAWTGRRILERMGCRVSDADSCRAAEEAWMANAFDLVVVDHRLPDGVGVDLIARMRAAGRMDRVICLTAESEEISGAQRAALGILDVVGKPLDFARFQAAVRAHAAAGSGVPAAPPAGGGAERRRIGRFDVIACPEVLTRADVDSLRGEDGAALWLALDMARTLRVGEGALDALRALSVQMQRSGGRLCLAAVNGSIGVELSNEGMRRDVDIVPALGGLEALSRNPISLCERAALMASAADEE
jgi:CheY-like chemotaxis protein